MKKYIRTASFDLDKTEAMAQLLKDKFKDKSLESLVRTTDPDLNGLITEYVISRRPSGRGIELYRRTFDPTTSRSFGGGNTLTTGYWYVAQHVDNIDDWEPQYRR